jgi:membrane-associated progesterone receptor component
LSVGSSQPHPNNFTSQTVKMDYVENRMAQGPCPSKPLPKHISNIPAEAAKPTPSPEVKVPPFPSYPPHLTSSRQTIATPLNLILLSVLIFIVYRSLRPAPKAVLPAPPPPTVFKTFTPPTLLPYNGTNNMPVYLAVRGRVFDVTSGRNFYGPGGPYENFAGRDASRGLACGSFDEEMLTKDLQGPLDTLEGLGADQMEALRGWEERFEEKYLVVGRLVAVGDEGKKGE